ncbi:NADH-quinone oxidoreductase subunit L [Anaeromyxobacter dehalogenans]|uniref:NADH dehydrogenase subunit L n=1 Tax=Anaeromyxobacter dehalogenans (strain 2CP-C) TaxID=290397 RepID=Q2IN05_ANADE|nr:NADH-quinone oxidoreductase subunit L [Anaeromyxobacter dehalogenans]ABC80189.1 NADH dehydrogenase subunit L [Anaeromyxobacter dehalogenans 2CP-C]
MPSIVPSPAAAESYLWAIILFPLAGAIVNGLTGRRLGRGNVTVIAIGVMVGAFLVSSVAFYHALTGTVLRFRGEPWIQVTGADGRTIVSIGWGLLVDRLSATMIMVVTGVGTLIHVYSASYMSHEDDAGYARFFTYLNLFVAAMLTLVLGDSLILTFVGWEGVGLCSYLLIGFWYTDPAKAYAGRKAFVTNRIGDFGFLIGVFALFSIFGTVGYADLQSLAHGVDPAAAIQTGVFAGRTYQAAVTFALIGLFVGACGKSAQLPLYVWLPDAMAGPTPVSALIHAATMVTAGVYLVARNAYLFSLAPAAMATVTIVGAATALFAALIAFVQTDIKKVLAYSTVSQLGFMFIGVGVGAWWAGVLHLVTHAFFKACLFLGAGSVMHGMHEDTDIRNMGGLARKMPHTAATFGIATLAITGFVPLSGFFSKDAILGNALFSHNPAWHQVGQIAYVLGSLAALGTAFYMSRLFFLTFTGKPRTAAAAHAHESSPVMYVPLWVLAILSIVALLLGLPGHGPLAEVFARFTEPVFAAGTERLHEVGHLHAGAHPAWPFAAAWALAAVGTLVAYLMYAGALRAAPAALARTFPRLYQFAVDKFRVDELYQMVVIEPLKTAAYLLWRIVDVFAIDGLVVNGVARLVGYAGSVLRLAQNGDVQRYAAIMVVAAAVILWTVVGAGGR